MKVSNNSDTKIKVSINRWGKDGDTSYFTIEPGNSGSWNRSDSRGFLMCVEGGIFSGPYYVQGDAHVIFSDDKKTTSAIKIT